MASSKRLHRIPILEAVAELARRYEDSDPELKQQLQLLKEAKEQERARHEEALLTRGIDCAYCGKRFVPYPDDYSGCCSIACQWGRG